MDCFFKKKNKKKLYTYEHQAQFGIQDSMWTRAGWEAQPTWAPELTCDSGQVLNSGGLPSSCLSHQKNRLAFGYTHRQLFQQH